MELEFELIGEIVLEAEFAMHTSPTVTTTTPTAAPLTQINTAGFIYGTAGIMTNPEETEES